MLLDVKTCARFWFTLFSTAVLAGCIVEDVSTINTKSTGFFTTVAPTLVAAQASALPSLEPSREMPPPVAAVDASPELPPPPPPPDEFDAVPPSSLPHATNTAPITSSVSQRMPDATIARLPDAVEPFDETSLPHTAVYFRGLPHGLASYPECQVRADVAAEILRLFPEIFQHPGIAPEVVETISSSLAKKDWMPDVQGVVARLLVRDIVCKTDQEYLDWSYRVAGELFKRQIFKVLMYVLSPTLVLLGTEKRWSAFRRGTMLKSRVDKNSAMAELRFPTNLYTPVVLQGFGEAFRASLTAARATDPKVELVEASPELARWSVRWR